jgi:hypothetical protein
MTHPAPAGRPHRDTGYRSCNDAIPALERAWVG